jgi:hypothetical protein
MRAQRGDAFARPAVAVAGEEAVPVQDAGDEIVAGEEHQLPHGGDDVGRSAVTLSLAPARQAEFGMNAAHPVDHENDLGGPGVDIGDDLVDNGADDALLEPCVRRWSVPDGFEIVGQIGERDWGDRPRRCRGAMSGDFCLDLGNARERLVPARLQFARDQPVRGISGVILAEGAVRREAGRFEIAQERLADLIAPLVRFRLGHDSRRNGSGLDDLKQCHFDRVIDA